MPDSLLSVYIGLLQCVGETAFFIYVYIDSFCLNVGDF